MAEDRNASLTFFDLEKICLEERIGKGNFSVFKARMAGKMMAVKKMDCHKNKVPDEVKIHSVLPPHLNIIRLFGVTHSQDGFSIYICMELADKSLYKYLHTEKEEPSLEKGTKWAKQVAMGIDHLHQHGLAHLDLKSQNILLFERESILKLCDFGETRVLEGTVTMTGPTGTYRYMAPEFNSTAKAKLKINQRCDVFSYGMILYEIFVHKIPFENIEEGHHVPTLIQKKERPHIPPEVPVHIISFIESCWEHDPRDRPTSEKILQMFVTFPSSEKKVQGSASIPIVNVDDVALNEVIGRSQYTVYRGVLAGKAVAVKRMDCHKNEIPREVEVHSSLPAHPNIIPLLGVAHSRDGFSINIFMELADKSLYRYLHKEKRKPSLQQSTKWAMQIAIGMQHIHQHGEAHRNLKSENSLLFEKEDVLKLGGFGCARPLEHTSTMTGAAGIYRWMAPEFNYRAPTKANQCCDVFSYGMVMYEIFAHEIPFHDINDNIDVVPAIRDGKRPPIPPGTPLYIQQLMQSCWKHEPHDRPTFEEIMQTLDTKGAYTGWTPLHEAAQSGDVKALQRIGAQVNANAQHVKDGKTALHIASEHGYVDFVRVLISIVANVDINLQDKNRHTALYYASWKGHTAIVQLLLKERADVSICNKNGASPLYVASQEGHTEVVDALLNAGADPNLSTKNTNSVPLGKAAENGHTETVKRLLKGGANSDHQNKFGKTALYYATWKKHAEIASLLVQDHADSSICNEDAD